MLHPQTKIVVIISNVRATTVIVAVTIHTVTSTSSPQQFWFAKGYIDPLPPSDAVRQKKKLF